MNKETLNYINREAKEHTNFSSKSFGSSLKICKVADGEAHCYPRFGPTMEWDTAAAHAVAKFAGCSFFKACTHEQLSYNKQNLLNPFFIVKSK
jgi:3'(2'), 5'-bisphosphate nucleotidase